MRIGSIGRAVALTQALSRTLGYTVPGFVCDRDGEQLIDHKTALEIQASQTPTLAWHQREIGTTQLDATVFDPLRASTEHVAA